MSDIKLSRFVRELISRIPLHLWIAMSSIICKGIVLLVQLWGVKYFISVMSVDNYSTFVLISALSPWILLTDVGVGSALQNNISEKRSQSEDPSNILYNGLILAFLIAFIFMFLFALSSETLSAHYLTNISKDANKAQAFIVFFALTLFIGASLGAVAQKSWFALQKGWIANILLALGSVISLIIIKIFGVGGFDDVLFGAVILFFAPTAITSLISLFIIFSRSVLDAKNYYLSRHIMINLLKRGVSFWVFAIFAGLVLQADYIILSQESSAEDILLYSVMQKVFGVAIFIYAAVLQALWPRCAELQVAGNYRLIKRITAQHIGVGLFGGIVFTALIYFFNDRLFALFGVSNPPAVELILLFGFYNLLRIWTDTYGMIMQSMNMLYPLWVLVPLQAFVSIVSQLILTHYLGIEGIVLGLIIGYILTVTPICPIIVYRKLKTEI